MSKQQRLVLIVSILASLVAFLDGSIVNVALPAITQELGGGLSVQQWVVDAYLITLGSLILVAGSVSDLFGRKRVLMTGLVGFGLSSFLCAVAPTSHILILARALQGVAGALLVPSSLALIIGGFSGPEQGKAIGSWTAWTGIAFLIGPLLGGYLVDAVSWRLAFGINIFPIALTLWLLGSLRLVDRPKHNIKIDVIGAALCALGLGATVYALIEQAHLFSLLLGLVLLGIFIWYERRIAHPILPLSLFKVGNFSYGNLATTAIYAGLSAAMFLITIFVQQVGHYSALASGLALLPVTIIMFLLSSRFGSLAGRYGPRFFMTAGPIVASLGFLSMLFVNQSVAYWTQLLPGVLIFGIGLSMTVAPLTTAVLSDIDNRQAGIASAVNNAVARIAGLLATAAIGLVVTNTIDIEGFKRGLIWIALVLIVGGIISAIGIRNPELAKATQ